jgi:pimeloyl-ACP methyl ester carboxylesterase
VSSCDLNVLVDSHMPPSGRRIFTLVAIALWWPAAVACALLVAPFYLIAFVVVNAYNMLRASRWSLVRFVSLGWVVAEHFYFLAIHAPLFASVAWYYGIHAPRDHVKKGIPYAERIRGSKEMEAQVTRQLHHLGENGKAEPVATTDATGTPTKLSSPTVAKTASGDFLLLDVYFHHRQSHHRRSKKPDLAGTASETPDTASPTTSMVPDGYGSPRSTSMEVASPLGASPSPRTASAFTAASPSSTNAAKHGHATRRPVIVFLYGGAWGSGARWYYAKIAAALREVTGALVVVPDYDAYPVNGMAGMVISVHRALQWVHENIARYGGDPRSVTIVGHSAGAHLAFTYLLYRAMAVSGVSVTKLKFDDYDHLPGAGAEPIPLFTSWPKLKFNYPTPIPGSEPTDIERAFGLDERGKLPPQVAVSLPPITSVVLFAGCFDVPYHFCSTEMRRCVELISTAQSAVCGHWGAFSPTLVMKALQERGSLVDVVRNFPTLNIAFYQPELDSTVHVSQSERLVELLNTATAALDHENHGKTKTSNGAGGGGGGLMTVARTLLMKREQSDDSAECPALEATVTVVFDEGLTMGIPKSGKPPPPPAREEASPNNYMVRIMPGLKHSDVVLGPMMQERPLHPTFVAIARAVHMKPKQP